MHGLVDLSTNRGLADSPLHVNGPPKKHRHSAYTRMGDVDPLGNFFFLDGGGVGEGERGEQKTTGRNFEVLSLRQP